MNLLDSTAVIPYSSASNMARAFVDACEKLRDAKRLVDEATEMMEEAFQPARDTKHWQKFEAKVCTGCHHGETEEVEAEWKVKAWHMLIEKLGVLKTMSAKRRDEFNKLFTYGQPYTVKARADSLPDISEETIFEVLMGYCSSAEEFLEEAIREEYDFWKCHNSRHELKTNHKSLWKLDRKVIKGYMVGEGYRGKFECSYDREKHLIALDNIFHLLDGKGCIASGTRGPLVDTIVACDGIGETEYFRFRCFKNGNLHLEFKRADLLQRFNEICGRNRLPEKESA